MNGKEFVEGIQLGKFTSKEAADIIDGMNEEAEKMAAELNQKACSPSALNGVLCDIYEYADKSPELNMNNVDMEDVSALNDAMVEIYLLLCLKGIDKLYAGRESGT